MPFHQPRATGDAYFRSANFHDAVKAYRDGLKLPPVDPHLREALGTALARQGQIARALVALRTAVFEEKLASPTARAKYALLACEYGAPNHALQQLDAWLEDDPNAVVLLLTRARVLAQMPQDCAPANRLGLALADARNAARLASDEQHRSAAFVRAMIHAQRAEYDEARNALPRDGSVQSRALDKVIRLIEDPEAVGDLVDTWLTAEITPAEASEIQRLLRLIDAVEVSRSVLEAWKKHETDKPLVFVGFAHFSQWLADRARIDADRQKHLADALDYARQAYDRLRLDPACSDEVRATVVWTRGVARAQNHDHDGALEDFRGLLHLRGPHPDPDFNIALLYCASGRGPDSVKQFQAYLQQFGSDDVYAVCELAVAIAMAGDSTGDETALEHLEDAVLLFPGNGDALLNRGIVRRRLLELDKAAEDFARARALRGNADDLDLQFDWALLHEARFRRAGSSPPAERAAVMNDYKEVIEAAKASTGHTHVGACIRLGVLQMFDPTMLEQSIANFQAVLDEHLDPARDIAISLKALALMEWSRTDNDLTRKATHRPLAVEALRTAAEPTRPGPQALVRVAALLRIDDYAAALHLLELFPDEEGQNPLTAFYGASAYIALKRKREAAERLDRFFALTQSTPFNAELFAVASVHRAALYHEAADYAKGLALLDEALARDGVSDDTRAQAEIAACRALVAQGRYADARLRAADTVDRHPGSCEAMEVYGYATVRYGESVADMDIVSDGIVRLESARSLLMNEAAGTERTAAQARIAFQAGYAHGLRQEFRKAKDEMSEAERCATLVPAAQRPFNPVYASENLRRLNHARSTDFDLPAWMKWTLAALCILLLGALWIHVQVPDTPLTITQPNDAALATITIALLLLVPTLFLLPALSKIKFGTVELQRVEAPAIKWATMEASLQNVLLAARRDGEAWQYGIARSIEDASSQALTRAAGADLWRPLRAGYRASSMPDHWKELAIGVFHGREIFAVPHDRYEP